LDLPKSSSLPEPWLRGILPGFDPAIAHLLRASEQVREDMRRAIATLTPSQLWTSPVGTTPVGFHAKHLAGSTDRLCTYLAGSQLSAAQLTSMQAEGSGGETAAELLAAIEAALTQYEALLRVLRPEEFGSMREVGRQRLKVTAIGLAIHIAEHAQRHTGQAITAAQSAAHPA
jgi:hypothetical protein